MNNYNIHLEIRNPKKQAIDTKLEAMACYLTNRQTEEHRNGNTRAPPGRQGLGFQRHADTSVMTRWWWCCGKGGVGNSASMLRARQILVARARAMSALGHGRAALMRGVVAWSKAWHEHGCGQAAQARGAGRRRHDGGGPRNGGGFARA